MKIKEKIKKNFGGRNQIISLSVVLVVVFFLLIIGFFTYGLKTVDNPVVEKVTSIIPFPAAFGSDFFLSIGELEKRKKAVIRFYENQDFSEMGMRVDFSTDEGKRRLEIKEKDLLNKMIEDAIISELARERGIKITPNLIKQSVERKIQEYSSGDYLRENMDKLYGWNLDDFEKRIVQPDLYKENLKNYVEEKEGDSERKQELIAQAKMDLDKGKKFEEVVKAYSEGESANSAGDLGWFSKKQILPEISEAIFSLNNGETSGILESSLGFHLVNLVDKKTEKETEFVKIRQIFVRKQDFGEWLFAEKKKRSVWIPIRGLFWNREEGKVDFENQEMREYEKQMLESQTGDASLIF